MEQDKIYVHSEETEQAKEDMINHPKHYCVGGGNVSIECIDITRHLSFSRGNAFKYIWRYGEKGDNAKAEEDLNKALWYIDDCMAYNPQEDLSKARIVFELLPQNTEFKYTALALLLLNLEEAQTFIWSYRDGLKNNNQ